MTFDAHTHLDFPAFDADRDAVCARARRAGITGWVVAGASPTAWGSVRSVARETGGIAVLGLHPWWARDMPLDAIDAQVERLADLGPHPGIGETGLDHLRARTPLHRRRQTHALRRQLALARELDVPVVLHCVRAYPELFSILRRDGLPDAGGMLHGWSGPPDAIDEALSLGLSLSIGPRVCFDRATRQRAAAAKIPLDRLLLETDCPDTPLPGRSRGEPSDLTRVADIVADLRGIPPRELLLHTGRNARRLWHIRGAEP